MPAIYRYWRLMSDTGSLVYPGSIMDQPHIFLMEMEACQSAVDKWNKQKAYLKGTVLAKQE